MSWHTLASTPMLLTGRASTLKTLAGHALPSSRLRSAEPLAPARLVSTAVHFYQNRQLEAYASKPATRLTLRQLVCLEYQ